MTDRSHLDALELRLSHERAYLGHSATVKGVALRKVWIAQIEREIADERKRLGLSGDQLDMTDDELLKALRD